jgi:hypothetical protein
MEATMITSPFPLSIDLPREDGSRLQGRVLIEPAAPHHELRRARALLSDRATASEKATVTRMAEGAWVDARPLYMEWLFRIQGDVSSPS